MYNRVIEKPLCISGHLFDGLKLFGPQHWWQLLKGCNRYENIKSENGEEFVQYGKLMMDVHSNRMDTILKVFPNHYDYLTEWYEDKKGESFAST